LYLRGRGTSPALRETLRSISREGGRVYGRDLDRRVDAGLKGLVETDRRETMASGATLMELVAADGQRLFASLYRPKDEARSGEVRAASYTGGVLLLHALGSNRAACASFAKFLAGRGLPALAI